MQRLNSVHKIALLMSLLPSLLIGCRRNESPPFVTNSGEYLTKLDAARTKYESNESIDNLREYQNFLHSLPGVDNWPCTVTALEASDPHNQNQAIAVHGLCGATKVKLTCNRSSREPSTTAFDLLTKVQPGQIIHFTGVLDVGQNLSWDHPDPVPDELSFAVTAVAQ